MHTRRNTHRHTQSHTAHTDTPDTHRHTTHTPTHTHLLDASLLLPNLFKLLPQRRRDALQTPLQRAVARCDIKCKVVSCVKVCDAHTSGCTTRHTHDTHTFDTRHTQTTRAHIGHTHTTHTFDTRHTHGRHTRTRDTHMTRHTPTYTQTHTTQTDTNTYAVRRPQPF